MLSTIARGIIFDGNRGDWNLNVKDQLRTFMNKDELDVMDGTLKEESTPKRCTVEKYVSWNKVGRSAYDVERKERIHEIDKNNERFRAANNSGLKTLMNLIGGTVHDAHLNKFDGKGSLRAIWQKLDSIYSTDKTIDLVV
jgi:hypothetical protein